MGLRESYEDMGDKELLERFENINTYKEEAKEVILSEIKIR